jgi:hypothetical protein
MSAEQIREFRNGLLAFECDGVTFRTLVTNCQNSVNNLPADLHSQELTNARFKAQILREFRTFINENIKDYIEHGNIMGGNFKATLEELTAGVVADHQLNNAIKLWNTEFEPLVDIYESMVECMDEYYKTVWAPNNANNANNENPGAPAVAARNAPPIANDPVPPIGGRHSRRSRKSRHKSRRNNYRRSKRNARR